ncbi:MAG: hypothetical protein IPL98_08670 [Saprospiraceae bacterium]|nr:hypothetical protein [Saprospiraceae bacterium]
MIPGTITTVGRFGSNVLFILIERVAALTSEMSTNADLLSLDPMLNIKPNSFLDLKNN